MQKKSVFAESVVNLCFCQSLEDIGQLPCCDRDAIWSWRNLSEDIGNVLNSNDIEWVRQNDLKPKCICNSNWADKQP